MELQFLGRYCNQIYLVVKMRETVPFHQRSGYHHGICNHSVQLVLLTDTEWHLHRFFKSNPVCLLYCLMKRLVVFISHQHNFKINVMVDISARIFVFARRPVLAKPTQTASRAPSISSISRYSRIHPLRPHHFLYSCDPTDSALVLGRSNTSKQYRQFGLFSWNPPTIKSI